MFQRVGLCCQGVCLIQPMPQDWARDYHLGLWKEPSSVPTQNDSDFTLLLHSQALFLSRPFPCHLLKLSAQGYTCHALSHKQPPPDAKNKHPCSQLTVLCYRCSKINWQFLSYIHIFLILNINSGLWVLKLHPKNCTNHCATALTNF